MTLRIKATLVALVSTLGICQSAMAINISESDLPGGLELDGSQSYVLDLGSNTISGIFSIFYEEENFQRVLKFDLDNFGFTVQSGHQLDSLEIDLGLSDYFPNDIDWESGPGPIDPNTGLYYDLILPVADSFKIDPHNDLAANQTPIGGPLLAGDYDYSHGLRAITNAVFDYVNTPYTITLEVSRSGQSVPTPDSGSTMLLSLLGLSCLFAVKRYVQK